LGLWIGYLGSIVGLLIALPLAAAHRLDLLWLTVAGFFAVFSLPGVSRAPGGTAAPRGRSTCGDWRATSSARPETAPLPAGVLRLLDGVETTIYFSGIFAAKTLDHDARGDQTVPRGAGFRTGRLALLARPTDRLGPKRSSP